MKHRIALSLALGLVVAVLTLMSFDRTASAQKQCKSTWDTGVVALGSNQMLRIIVVNRGGEDSSVRFSRMEYSQGSCNSGVCKQSLIEEITFPTVVLAPNESASIDIQNSSFGVRGAALFNSCADLGVVVAQVINISTGEVVAIMREDEILGVRTTGK